MPRPVTPHALPIDSSSPGLRSYVCLGKHLALTPFQAFAVESGIIKMQKLQVKIIEQ